MVAQSCSRQQVAAKNIGGRGAMNGTNTLLEAALSHHSEGSPCIGVTKDKKPYHEGWAEYFHRQQTREEVEKEFSNGAHGVAVVLYPACQYVVLDFDGPHAQAAWQLTKIELPETARNITRSGGMHLIFRMPASELPELKRKVRLVKAQCDCAKSCGVDLLVHGYAVMPPTPGYTEDPDFPLESAVTIPREILNLVQQQPKHEKRVTGDVNGRVRDGERNSTACSLAGSMKARGMSLEAIRAGLKVDSEKRFDPPLDEKEIESVLKSAAKWPEHPTPNSNDSKAEGVGVNCYPEELEEEFTPETKLVAFPEDAWRGPFLTWRDIVSPCTESPAEYLWASCLIVVGLDLGRNVRIENPRPLFPNFYALLMGRTGDDRKSTALWYAAEALSQLLMANQVDMLRGIQSAEAVYESLSRMDGAKSLAYCDEFRSLLSVAKRKGTHDIIPRLASLYYCPEQDSLNRSEDSTVIKKPFLSLIAATPPEYVQDLLSNLEIDGGFLNRFLTITGEVSEWKAIAPRAQGWSQFVAPMKAILSHYDDNECAFGWTERSREIWIQFYTELKKSRQGWNPRDQKLTARIDEHTLKLAMVYSAIEKESVITEEALATAIKIGKWLQQVTLNAFGDVGQDYFSRAEKIVLDVVKAKGKIYRRYLQQWVHKKGINGEILTRVITSLVKNGQLKEGKETMSSGQERPWVAYIPKSNQEALTTG
jgi:Primase C terminal 1 (PriCT-1)/Protein of unknown function (DUF3987)/Bifunctional DNA primase/polymerase, N-terminal